MLEKLFPSQFIKDPDATDELNQKWGSAFNVFQNPDIQWGDSKQATPSNALTYSSVYACVNVLSDDIAKLPFKTYQRDEKGSIREITDNDIYSVIRVRPNSYMSPFTFIKLLITDLCLHGNFYAFIHRNNSGEVEELIPLTSTLTRPFIKDGELFYQTLYNSKNITLYSDEVIHVKGMSVDGLVGLSPIESVRNQMNAMYTADKLNYDTLRGGGMPKGILTVQGQLSGDAKRKVRDAWQYSNSNESIAIVDSGMDYKQTGLSQSDMQWLESQRYNQQQIASIYKVPLHKINDLEHATYTNIEHQSLDYVKNTLQPLVTQIEYEFTYKLYTEEERKQRYYVKFNMDSELRGDSEARAKVNEINFRNGFKTINEVRASNEDSPFDKNWADQAFITLNYAPADRIEDYQNNQFGKSMNGLKGGEEDGKDNGQTTNDDENGSPTDGE